MASAAVVAFTKRRILLIGPNDERDWKSLSNPTEVEIVVIMTASSPLQELGIHFLSHIL